MPAPAIAAVVVTYNRKELLIDCIEHLKAQIILRGLKTAKPCKTSEQFDILVIDNASSDGTKEALAPFIKDKSIRYFNTGENLGGAGGFNYGMKTAVEAGYEYCWIMDDDCLPHPDALQALIDADYGFQGEYGYLSSVVRWIDGSPCQMNIQRHPLVCPIQDFKKDLQPCTLASFVSLFVPSRVIQDVGLPIKDFFIWTDDWEFTRRISRKYDCFVVGKSVVMHASANNGAGTIVDDIPERLDRYRLIYRNDVVLYRKEGCFGWCFLAVRAAVHALRVILQSPDNKLKKLGIIVQGTGRGVFFDPVIEYPDPPRKTLTSQRRSSRKRSGVSKESDED